MRQRTIGILAFAAWAPAVGRADTVAGKWKTSEGEMTLSRSGDAVTGRYSTDNGEIAGGLSGAVLTGFWIEDSSARKCAQPKNGRFYWGRIRFEFEGDRFAGIWSYCDEDPSSNNKWTGTRLASAPVPDAPPSPPAPPAAPAESVLFENWNKSACQHTDRTAFELHGAAHVSRLVAWVEWAAGSAKIGFWVRSAGKVVHRGVMKRGSCDSHQPRWCEAVADLRLEVPQGIHFLDVAKRTQCQNSGSKLNGFLKVFGTTRR